MFFMIMWKFEMTIFTIDEDRAEVWRRENSFWDFSFIMAAMASTSVLSLFPVGIDSKSEEERRICCLCNKGLARKYLFTFLRVCDLMSSSRCVHSSHFFSFSLSFFSVLFSSLLSSGHSTLSNHMKKKHRCNHFRNSAIQESNSTDG